MLVRPSRTRIAMGLLLAIGAATTSCTGPSPEGVSASSSPDAASATATLGPPSRELPLGWSRFDDDLLELRLRLSLLEKVGIAALGVAHRSSGGTVWLDGRVPDPRTASLIVELARQVPGVIEIVDALAVTNDLEIAVGPLDDAARRLDDSLLAARTRTALVQELGRRAFELEIEASDSDLYLSGTLADRDSLDRALAAARGVRGVHQIHHRLGLEG